MYNTSRGKKMQILYFLIYFVIINLIGFIVMYRDKRKAIKYDWRISEKNIFLVALFFGSIRNIYWNGKI